MYDDHPYLECPNMIITPHVAWAAVESRTRLINRVADNLAAFASGKPINVVNR
jgi:glycerate dehydrogenase